MHLSNSTSSHSTTRGPWFRRLIAGGILIAILAAVALSAKPAYHAFRDHRLRKNLEAATEAARLEDWATARDKARSVLLVRQDNFQAFRIWCRALAKQREPNAYMAAAQWFANAQATDDDRLEALGVLANQAPQAVAFGAYLSLPEVTRNRPEFRATMTPLLILRGQVELAEKGLRGSMGDNPSPEVILELIRTICVFPSPDRLKEARKLFANLVANEDARPGLAALLLLGSTPGGLVSGDVLPREIQGWVSRQPGAETIHHLVALQAMIDADPTTADRLYLEAIERYSATDPGVLGTWLVQRDRSEQALAMLEEPAKIRADAFLAKLNALLRLKRDDEIKQALLVPPPTADMVEVEIVRAVIASRSGDESGAAAAWTKALNEAAFDTRNNRFLLIAETAGSYGAKRAAEDAWVAAIRSGWGQLPLYYDLSGLYVSLGNQNRTEDLLAMFRTFSRLEPGNLDLQNNYLYLALIHRVITPSEAASRLAELVKKHPKKYELNSSLMLAEIMAGRPGDALSRLLLLRDAVRVPPKMQSALEGTARVLSGEPDAGATLLRSIQWNTFLRQERQIFQELLAKHANEQLPLPEPEVADELVDPANVPSWRKAVQKMEQDRAGDILPPLPQPEIKGIESYPLKSTPQ